MSEENSGKKMLLTAGFMAAATLVAKVLGLIRDSLIAAFFATGMQADAFMAASKLPTTLFDMVIGGVISATFIPVFNDIITKENKDSAVKFANKFITMILMITVLISLIGIVFADPLVNMIAPNYTGEKHELTVQLTSIMFPMIIFTGLAFSFVGLLQSFGEYNIPSVISLVSNLAIIIYFVLFGKKFGVQGLAVTMLVAWSLQVAVQIPSLIKFKFVYKPDFRLADPHIKQAILLAGPMLISTWVQPLYTIINSRLASGIDGAYSSLEYANRLYLIVTGVFSFVVTNLIFPKLSRANASENRKEAQKLVTTSLKAIAIIIIPLMAGFMILSAPITSLIYEHGEFNESRVSVVAQALGCYSAGMIGLAVNEILSKAFFSMQDSKTPMVNSIISMVFNIVAAYILFNFLHVNGLALAAAAGSICNAVLNGMVMAKKCPGALNKKDFITIIKIIFAAAVMSAAVLAVYRWANPIFSGKTMKNIFTIAACGISGVVVYGALVWILKVDEIRALVKK